MTAARGLVDAELVFPMLDGLDRMSADNRAAALTALGESRFPFALACRTDDYAAAVELAGPPIGAAAVVLAPIAAPDVVAYVAARADAGSSEAAPLLSDVVKSVGDEPTALQPLTEALRRPRMIDILVRSALGDGCRPVERLLLPDIAEAGVKLKTTQPEADPALTDIARQISERAGHMLPWWHVRGSARAHRVTTALLSALLAGIAAISLAVLDWWNWALVYGLAVFAVTAAVAYRDRWSTTCDILDSTIAPVGNAPGRLPVAWPAWPVWPVWPVMGAVIGAFGILPMALSSISPLFADGTINDPYDEFFPTMSIDIAAPAVFIAAVTVALIVTALAKALRVAEVAVVMRHRATQASMVSAMRRTALARFLAFGAIGIAWGFGFRLYYGDYTGGIEWFQGVAVGLFFAYALGLAPSLWYRTFPARRGPTAAAFKAVIRDGTLRPVGPQYAFVDDRLVQLLARTGPRCPAQGP
jgi:hypothetical protein